MMDVQQQMTPYQLLGGEQGLKNLVQRFYFYMDSLPEVCEIRKIHTDDLSTARQKLFKFLSGWLGGPNLYIQEFGHPRLRKRHFPFAIAPRHRDQWLLCMRRALDEMAMQEALREQLWQAFSQLATHMINQEY